MRITYIIAGAGRMECDICLRDGRLARALKARGHDVLFVPLYTPLPRDFENAATTLFYGGVNVYLQQKLPVFRHTPRALDRLFDNRQLLDFVSRFGHMTQPSDLAEMTISVLEGKDGNQSKELERMLAWLGGQPRPEAVILPYTLLAGLAGPLRQALGCPVYCLLSGEDVFVEGFPEPHRARARQVLRRCAGDIDGFLASSRYYAGFMADWLRVAPERIKLMIPGIDIDNTAPPQRTAPPVFTIGYHSQICPQQGFDTLIDAFIVLRRRFPANPCRLRVSGHLALDDRPFYQEQLKRLSHAGLDRDFCNDGELALGQRSQFLREIDVCCVAPVYPEPMGLFVPEALAEGTPVVVSHGGCLPEWIQATGGGLLVEPGNAAALADALAKLAQEPQLARQLGETGRAAVINQFSAAKMAESILQALEP